MDMLKPLNNLKIFLLKFIITALALTFQSGIAQVGIGLPSGQDPEATLDVGFDNTVAPGFLMPRVNNLPEATIESPITEGMLVYYAGNDSSLVNSYYVYIDGEWKTLAETAGIILPGGGGGCTTTELCSTSFEDDTFNGTCWNDGGDDCSLVEWPNASCDGDFSVRLRDGTDSSNLYSDVLDLSAYSRAVLEFKGRFIGFDNDWWRSDYLDIQYRNDSGSWINLVSYYGFNENFCYSFSEEFNDISSTTQFRINADASWDEEYAFIDEITITGYCN